MIKLELREDYHGVQKPYCFMYSPICGKCKNTATVRSVKKSRIERTEFVEILFQCDVCKLRWHIQSYMTRKNIRASGPRLVTTDAGSRESGT